jgi:hypothetical protein
MKKLAILLLLMPVFGWSQNVWFEGLSKDSALLMANTIVGMAKHKFSFKEEYQSTAKQGDGLIIKFVLDSTKGTKNPEYLDIVFQRIYVGKDVDLEIIGTPRYFFKKIPAIKLLDIAPFWKAYVDEKYDVLTMKGEQEKILKQQKNSAPKRVHLDPDRQGYGFWEFYVH